MIPKGSMRRRNTTWPLLLTILSTLLSSSAVTDTMSPGDKVGDDGYLVSADGSFKLGFFTPGKSKFRYLGIWYNTMPQQTVIWVANRDRPLPDSTGILSILGNGSLLLSDAKGEVYWTTLPTDLANPVAKLLNNSNFVVVGAGGGASGASYAWQSFDYPTDSLLPGMKLGLDLVGGRNRNITAWRSKDDPAPGEYAIGFYAHDDPQIFLMRGKTRLWRSGRWIGQHFSGLPEMKGNSMLRDVFYFAEDEVYYRFDTLDRSLLSRLTVQPTGLIVRMSSVDGTTWKAVWSAPKDQCDTVNPCGPFGVCDIDDSPMCSCVQGFLPRSPEYWDLRDGRDGCVRRTAVDCQNGTDGFVRMVGAKLPDTSAAVVDNSADLNMCREMCLRNCSCTAYANAEVDGGGTGCITWTGDLTDIRVYKNTGQDVFVRVAAADLGFPSSQSHRRPQVVAVVTAVVAALGTLLLGCIGWWYMRMRRKKMRRTTVNSTGRQKEGSSKEDDIELPLFDFRTIAAATDDFSTENKLGEGGFGPVYMGRLPGGQEVAVKRLARNSVQGLEELKNEVMLIAKLQHRNLVRLLGYCIQGEERMLIYEYMPNKSLDAFLFETTKGPLLDWKRRYQIINGIARGLLYLHQDSRFRIIHRDLKASNVLLDKEMNPKISDFGMARIFGGDVTEANTRRVVGTYGYMSPEYIMEGIFSVKSDVFSFGVMVLEIVSGKRNRGIFLSDPNLNLLGYAWSLWKAGKVLDLVESSMANSLSIEEVLKCIKVGLLCVQERPEDRPTMATVVQMLGNDTAPLLQPKQPGFMATRGPFEVSCLSGGKLCSINEVTVTMFEGR